jgi:hypothetical protein
MHMAFLSFLQKPQKPEEESDDSDKKIEFAQKLPPEDLEGEASRKGGNFDFLKGVEPRQDGQAVPVKLEAEPLPNKVGLPSEELNLPRKADKKGNFFSGLFSSGGKAEKNKKLFRVLEVDLVKGEIIKYFDWQKAILIILVSVFISITLLSLAYWGISWWGSSRQYDQDTAYMQDYYKVNKEIKDLEPQVNEVLKFKDRLDSADFLLKRHVYWNNFFSFLEKNTLTNVYFANFSGDTGGTYNLQATTDSLDAIDAQVKKFLTNPSVEKVSAGGVSIGESKGKVSINFSLSFSLNPEIFLK